MRETDRRDLRDAKKPRGLDPSMARDDAIAPVDQDRVGEAEGPDALRDLPDLLARVGTGVALEGLERVNVTAGDIQAATRQTLNP